MKTGMFCNTRLFRYDIYSLLVFFTGTTVALFSKKYYLFDGFKPVFYAALFGFMMSLVFRTLLKRDLPGKKVKKISIRRFIINTLAISVFEFVLLALALFIVWYISRLQGLIILDNINFWPNALLLCVCLGLCYSVYSFMEERFNRRLFH